MRKIASLFLLLALFSVFYGCGSKHSKAFLNLEKEANELERQIQEAVDCDDLMLFSFSILGLKSDVENLIGDETIKEGELETLYDMTASIEATLEGKIAALNCEEPTDDSSEIDTTGEDDYVDYNIL